MKLATEQRMTQVKKQAATEAAKAVIMVVREAESPVNDTRPMHTMSLLGSLVLRQPTFDRKTTPEAVIL